ncbi:hypothetical protein PF005_g4437 [Phytophthora fragariae]|uniref:LisH domain-containing protein n=1 Tax=Phytophthora fragariae TaxID=53985 RepID=A0A6A4EPJ0_9STRA|nr:hypothetical protein PF003_g5333 [Phytophthora fragariae]KAE8945689.1 hypothetical protein PF009_g4670 [Phytophthora fragariae]KAE9024357.1 hypothetical protein PF011_g3552 [Phytophthora fragariae]KAE9128725.1 hypothetical protein PF010_g4404 [Phytophthora fragariae]KAE9137952.1 hypothetical protein PF007_g1628 [Phytophthora fragariae]
MMSVLPTLLQPPPTAEELALKEQVTQVLTSQGVLAKLKAELRAAVFEVMHEREGFAKTNDPTVPKLGDFPVETRTIALTLIVEFLQFFRWEHALRVLLAEANADDEEHDSAQIAKKLGLECNYSSAKPTLFQLIESRVLGIEKSAVSVRPVTTIKLGQFDDEEESDEETAADDVAAPKARPWEQDEDVRSLPVKEPERIETESKEEDKDEDKEEDKDEGSEEAESSAEIEESMAEEVPSGSELEESNFTNYEDEESQDYRAQASKQPTDLYSERQQEKFQNDNGQEESHDKDAHESNDEDAVSLAAPPPAPAKLPSLPPLVGASHGTDAGDTEDDFDAEEEADRLRKLDAALQAMEAEDDTGTLQQLKKSLQMELQEQDSLVSSGGLGKTEDDDGADAEPQANKSRGEDEEDGDGYGSSDFEEEEEIVSEISEEVESMSELSDKEDESEGGAAASAAEIEPPNTLRNDTRVDSEDALNSYDYIEGVERGGW